MAASAYEVDETASPSLEPSAVSQEYELETRALDVDGEGGSKLKRPRGLSKIAVFEEGSKLDFLDSLKGDIKSVPDNLSRNIDDFLSLFDRNSWKWGKSTPTPK